MVLDKTTSSNLPKTDTVLINNLSHSYGLGENKKKVLDGLLSVVLSKTISIIKIFLQDQHQLIFA